MPPTRLRHLLAVPLLLLAAVAAPAATINVAPGPGTPVQDAIDAASPGDTVRLAGGGYPEAIVITKPLRLVGPAGTVNDNDPAAAVIAAGCAAGTTGITVAADDVKISDLRVILFTEYGIDVQGRDKLRMRNVLVLPNCPPDPPIANVNVVASTRVKIDQGWFDAFDVPATALRLSGLAANAHVKVTRTLTGGNDVGMLIENCAPNSLSIVRSYANYNNGTGILLQNSDGILLKRNQVAINTDNGIVLDASSDDNRLVGNDIHGSTTDVTDAGIGNCWKKNKYLTGNVPSCP